MGMEERWMLAVVISGESFEIVDQAGVKEEGPRVEMNFCLRSSWDCEVDMVWWTMRLW